MAKRDYIDEKSADRRSNKNGIELGVFSLLVGIAVLVIFIVLIPMSVSDDKTYSSSITSLAFLDFILSICGMAMSANAVKNHSEHYRSSLFGLILNSVMFVGMICLYFMGL